MVEINPQILYTRKFSSNYVFYYFMVSCVRKWSKNGLQRKTIIVSTGDLIYTGTAFLRIATYIENA
jgi:hypothetical protein